MLCTPKLMLVGTREVGKPCEGLVYLDAGLSIKRRARKPVTRRFLRVQYGRSIQLYV